MNVSGEVHASAFYNEKTNCSGHVMCFLWGTNWILCAQIRSNISLEARVEAGSNTSTVGGDEKGTQRLGAQVGHPVTGEYKYWDLALQFWEVSDLRQ
jgi:hypothetical protein